MLLIPAIDLKEGRCVRLKQGRMDEADVFSDDPVAMAGHWRDAGCRRLHIVDLDGAFAGKPRNGDLIRQMVNAMGDIPVQVGGGVRTAEIAEGYLSAGVQSVIIGTRAVEDPAFLAELANAHPGRVILGLDARDGRVATEGWDETSSQLAVDIAADVAALPLDGIVYTDIERDGMLTGVNLPATLDLARAASVPVIASGGVATLEDLQRLKDADQAHPDLLSGVITGRALYAGTLDFQAGQQLLDS